MPGIKYLRIPAPVPIVTAMDDEPKPVLIDGKPMAVSFRRFVLMALEHESFRKSRAAFKASEELAKMAETGKPGEVLPVADDDLARLVVALEDTSVLGVATDRGWAPWMGWIVRQLRPLFDAIDGAKDCL